jgi:intracellular multiplication protein IcmB
MSFNAFVANMFGYAGGFLKKDLASYNSIETVDGQTLIAKDGSLATVVRIDGIKELMGARDLDRMVTQMASRLSSIMSKPGHAIQVWFSRDPDYSKQLVEEMIQTPKVIASHLDLSFDDVFEAKIDHLQKYIVQEGFYMVLWTRLDSLNAQERKQALIDMKPPKLWPAALDTQNVFAGAEELVIRHRTFAVNFVQDLKELKIRSEALEGEEALRAMRSSVYPDMTGSKWRPHIPGSENGVDKLTGKPFTTWPRLQEISDSDVSHLLWPRVDDQLFDREAEIINQHLVRIGAYNFIGVDMTTGPLDLMPFSDLLKRMTEVDEFPWRVSFFIEGDGMSSLSIKNAIASVLTFTSNDNKLISNAVKMLNRLRDENQGPMVRLRTSFATWAPADSKRLIEQRGSRLIRAVESWGGCLASMSAGDPLAGVMSSTLALDVRSTAPAGVPPLRTALSLLPLLRDASPFDEGTVLFRTKDKRPWLFQPGSAQQDNSVDIIYAVPGKGKSVLMNTMNSAFCLSPVGTGGAGGIKLPRIAILDIGPSSRGLISLLKEALPPERRHEVEYTRLRNIPEHAINALDTQLGLREPLPLERDFLVNYLTVLGTPVGQSKPPAMLPELAGMLIDEVYRDVSDKTRGGHPKEYTVGLEEEVDEAIRKFDIRLGENPKWWTVVDKLFEKGGPAIRAAQMAQRHAVPRIEDLMRMLRQPQVMDMYGETRTDHDQKLTEVVFLMLNSALREYPILSDVTRFDLGDAQVVALDLDEMAPRGCPAADKQSAIAYMLGRYVLAKDFYLNEDLLRLPAFPEEYKPYHALRIRRLRETPKRLCFDEFHRTRETPTVRHQVVIDMREGRKWGVQVVLASQMIEDFDDNMISLATGIWILGVNTERDAIKAAEIFGLSQGAASVIKNDLAGPSPDGAPFLVKLEMKDGRHEHLLINTLSPVESWAFSTTPEDAALRNRLYSTVGAVETRRRLAKRFPGGSAKREILRRIKQAAEAGSASAELADGIIAALAGEIERQG